MLASHSRARYMRLIPQSAVLPLVAPTSFTLRPWVLHTAPQHTARTKSYGHRLVSTVQSFVLGSKPLGNNAALSSRRLLSSKGMPIAHSTTNETIENIIQSREPWQSQKSALKTKFPSGWQPRKKLSPDAMDGIRALHAKDPETYKTATLADQFKISPEAIRRILKSKWRPSEAEEDGRRERWHKRGEKIWSDKAAQGYRLPRKWRGKKQVAGRKKPRWRDLRSGNIDMDRGRDGGIAMMADRIG